MHGGAVDRPGAGRPRLRRQKQLAARHEYSYQDRSDGAVHSGRD